MVDPLRQEVLTYAHTIIVKVGTRVLSKSDGTLDEERIGELADQISRIVDNQRKVVLVSSGAVAAGMGRLQLPQRPQDIAQLQAVAAVGQTALIEAYDRSFREHHKHAAQVLLTAKDLDDRAGYLNVRNTLFSLLDFATVPIINENDTVAVDELLTTFGENDRLAALVTNLIQAPLMIVLSDVDGLFDGDPQSSGSRVISTVTNWSESISGLAKDTVTNLSKGGMASKLEAARMVTSAGESMIIANGRTPDVLTRVTNGELLGTLFVAQGKSIKARKRWIGFSAQTNGEIQLDSGAERAIVDKGRSLLAAGVIGTKAKFVKGDVLTIRNEKGKEIARGLTNYSSEELTQIMGVKSDQIAGILGHRPYTEVVHRDNLVLLVSEGGS